MRVERVKNRATGGAPASAVGGAVGACVSSSACGALLSGRGEARLLRIVLFALLLAMCAPVAFAQSARRTLTVSTRPVAPFVVRQNDRLTGFSVDLWSAIAERIGVETRWQPQNSVTDMLGAVQTNRADMALAAISITSDREKQFDFSQPIFNAGLQILVREHPGSDSEIMQALHELLSPEVIRFVVLVGVLVVIPAHLVWFAERHRKSEGVCETDRYIPGIFKSIWWAAATLSTQADEMPKTVIGRLIAIVWMFVSVVFVAYFTAQVTASLTVKQLRVSIKGPGDLPGKKVATIAGSTAEQYLKDKRVDLHAYNQIEQAFAALNAGDVEAVVYDAPVLLYYASHEGKGTAVTVGNIFKSEGYGILFPTGSALRKPVNQALLQLKEDGTYDKLYARWFGEDTN